jgi:hypothetical protein
MIGTMLLADRGSVVIKVVMRIIANFELVVRFHVYSIHWHCTATNCQAPSRCMDYIDVVHHDRATSVWLQCKVKSSLCLEIN